MTSNNDESFSYEIEIEKEYVQRLKVQREKVIILLKVRFKPCMQNMTCY